MTSFFAVFLTTISLLAQPALATDIFSVPEIIFSSNAQDVPNPSSLGMDIKAKSALILDNQSNVVFAKNEDEILPIASLTKLMSNLIIWESLKKQISLEEQDNFSSPFWSELVSIIPEKDKKAAQILAYPGDFAKKKDLLQANLVASANNATQSLVSLIEKNLPYGQFMDLMNQKAKSLGMKNTYFYEPTGLDPRNHSTAKDLSLLVGEFYKIKVFKEIARIKHLSVPVFNKSSTRYVYLRNTNELLDSFIPVYGKTGYLEESGYCFAGQFRVKGRDYTIVLLGSPTSKSRFNDIKALTWWVEKNKE